MSFQMDVCIIHLHLSPSWLADVVRSIAGLHKVIVFCDESEVKTLKDFLDNDCKACLVACNSSSERDIEGMFT